MVRNCELCKSPACIYCDSDGANLCWNCDFKVHGANFLVAKHSRTLLCRGCQSPTPWSAAGQKIGPTVTFCEKCSGVGEVNTSVGRRDSVDELDLDDESADDDDVDEDEDDEEEGDEEEGDEEEVEDDDDEEGDIQVVPWSSTPPPSVSRTSSSASEEEFMDLLPRKRNRESFPDLSFQDDMSRLIRRRENSSPVVTSEDENDDPPR